MNIASRYLVDGYEYRHRVRKSVLLSAVKGIHLESNVRISVADPDPHGSASN